MSAAAARTRLAPARRDLVSLVPPSDSVVWIGPETKLVGWDLDRFEVGTGSDRFARTWRLLSAAFDSLEVRDEVGGPGSGPLAFASFTFDEASETSVAVIPRVVVGTRDAIGWVTATGDPVVDDVDGGAVAVTARGERESLFRPWRSHAEAGFRVPRIRYAGTSVAEIEWLEAVESAIGEIRSGALEKVVLARDVEVWADEELDVRALAARLFRRFPQCYTFAIGELVGATPELLVRRMGRAVESLVLAGSARRSTDEAADETIGAELLASAKDAHEHRLAVESVADTLGPLCDDLRVSSEPWLLKLANVQHLATSVSGELGDDMNVLEIVGRLHPTAAVCGTPTAAALEVIRRLEPVDRGRYAGPVGWVDAAGNGEFGIALRCADVRGTRARLWAGNGIVDGSVPEAELEETRLKLRAVQSALEDSD
ncbi:MAG: isochorismate synthase [Actinomycetota bacterium]